MRRRSQYPTAGIAVSLFLMAGAHVFADSPVVDLRIDPGAVPGEVRLSWSGGSPGFSVYRSTAPADLTRDPNRIATTLEYALDDPAPGEAVFFRVESKGDCFQPVADALVRDDQPNAAWGAEETLRAARGVFVARSYLKFHLGAIPPGARIDDATLWLRQIEAPHGSASVQLHRAAGPWLESTVSWDLQPGLAEPYDEPPHAGGPGLRAWDVTSLVSGWIDGGLADDGLVLAPTQSGGSFLTTYDARETGSESTPRLCVRWTDPATAAIDRLKADSNTVPVVEFDHGVAMATEVDDPAEGDDDIGRALEFLERHGGIHGIGNPHDELFVDRIAGGPDGATVVFGVRREDARVRGEHIAVVVRNGRVRGTLARIDPTRQISGESHVSGRQAEQAARTGAGLEEPEVWGIATSEWLNPGLQGQTGGPTRRAWRVTVVGRTEGGRRETRTVHVDAESGTVLRVRNENESADRPGEDFDIRDAAQTGAIGCWFPGDTQWFDENGPTGYPGAAADLFLDGQNAVDSAHATYHLFYDRFRLRSWDGDDEEVQAMVHRGSSGAFYDPTCDHLEFGDRFAKLDVFAHEFGHAVDGNTADLDNCNEPGAVGESFSDLFGALVDLDWIAGNEIGRFASRSMEDPPEFFDPDHILPAVSGDGQGLRPEVDDPWAGNDNGWVHINSGIPNKVAYLTINGGVHNGLFVGGIDWLKGSQLYWETLRARLVEESKIVHARAALIGVARDFRARGLHGFGDAEVCAVINAWSSVGLGAPDTDCDGTANLPSEDGDGDGVIDAVDFCPNYPDPGQPDLDGDMIGDICDIDVDGDGVVNSRDNCARIANPDQNDADRDGVGDPCNDRDADGVQDLIDNCRSTPNPGQFDDDGDMIGNLCDDDRDGDGVPFGEDVCPRAEDPGQEDSDDDGVGDACDNCLSEPNPGQEDTDIDGEGDECDTDDDDDGIEDISDNCPTVWNVLQQDHDGDGVGTFCDDDEIEPLDSANPDLVLSLSYFDFVDGRPIRLPVFPCRRGLTCPERIGDDWFVEVRLELSRDYWIRVTDDRGFTVAKRTNDGSGNYVLRFEADPDVHWLDPASSLAGPFEGRRYFLELLAPPGFGPGLLEGQVAVERYFPQP